MKKSTLCKMISALLIGIFTFGQFGVMASAKPVDTSGYSIEIDDFDEGEARVTFYSGDFIGIQMPPYSTGSGFFNFNARLVDTQGNVVDTKILYMLFDFYNETVTPIINSTGSFSMQLFYGGYYNLTVTAALPDGSYISRTFYISVDIIGPR